MADIVKHKYGYQQDYNQRVAEGAIDENILYFLIDTQKIYKGSHLVSEVSIQFTHEVPTSAATDGKLYIVPGDRSMYLYYKDPETHLVLPIVSEIMDGSITSLNAFADNVIQRQNEGLSEDDNKLPTSATVYTAIDAQATKWQTL